MNTDTLKTPSDERTVMQDTDIAHLAGLFDGIGAATVHISKEDSYSLGYRFKPLLRIHRPARDTALIGKLDAYCDQEGVNYWLNEEQRDEGDSFEWVVDSPESILAFLNPMRPYLVSKYGAVEIMFDIIAAMDDDHHKTHEGFYELVGQADELRSYSRYGSKAKYTQEYFREEWSAEVLSD